MPVPYNYCVISKFEHHGRIDNRKLSGLVSRGWCIAHGNAHRCDAAWRRDIVVPPSLSLRFSLYCIAIRVLGHPYVPLRALHACTCLYKPTNFRSSRRLPARWTQLKIHGATEWFAIRYKTKIQSQICESNMPVDIRAARTYSREKILLFFHLIPSLGFQ